MGGGAPFQASAREVMAARDAVSVGKTDDARAALALAAAPIVKLTQRDRIDSGPSTAKAARVAGASVVNRGPSR